MYLVNEETKDIWSLINTRSNTTIIFWSTKHVQVSVNETTGIVNVTSLATKDNCFEVILFTGIVPVIWSRM